MDVRLIPYSLLNDSLVMFMIVVCSALMLLAFSRVGSYLLSEVRSIMYVKDYDSFFRTNIEINYLSILNILTIIVISLLISFYRKEGFTWTCLGGVTLYFFGKHILYNLVNWAFFDSSKRRNWNHIFMLMTIFEGITCFPFVLIYTFLGLPMKIIIICVAVVIILVKIVTIFKAFGLFFGSNNGFLQLILYFCTLEIIPVLILYGNLVK